MTESSDRAQRALRRASIRESGHCKDKAQTQHGKRNNDRRTKNENPPSKAVAHSRFAPPLATKSTITTAATAAAMSLANPTNDRKRSATSSNIEPLYAPSSSSVPTVGSIASNTRSSKKHRSGPPPPPPSPPSNPAQAQAPQGDLDDDVASAEAVAYRLKSAGGAATAAAAAAAATAATVTPAVPRRQILFGNEEAKKEQQTVAEDSGTAANNNTTTSNVDNNNTATLLPDGVVDIYPPRALSGKCKCVAEICLEQRAGFLHTANYGDEWQTYLRDKEKLEYPMLSTLSSSSSALTACTSPFSMHTKGSNRESSLQQDDDSPDSTASKSSLASSLSLSSSSSCTTAPPSKRTPGSLLRFDVRACKDTPRFLEETTGNLKRQPYITAPMRAVLVSWLVEVGTEYDISDQAFHLAITLLDLMLAKGPTDPEAWEEKRRRHRLRPPAAYQEDDDDCLDDSDDDSTEPDYFVVQRVAFQAFGCACAWIASKMEDRNPPLQDDFVYISDQSVSSGMLRRFEKRICKELNFNLHRLTPIHYANSFLRASNACPCLSCPFDHPVLRQLFLYLLELARIPVALVDCPPSLVAAAAIYLARATLGLREEDPGRQASANNNCYYWTKTLQHYTGYSVDNLKNTVLRIYEYQLQAEQLAIAPYIKFRSKARLHVSLKTVLRIEDLGFGLNAMGLNHDTLPLVTA